MDREYYIEFRVYLRSDAKVSAVAFAANKLQDKLADLVSDDGAPKIFTEDVTYQVRRERVIERDASVEFTENAEEN